MVCGQSWMTAPMITEKLVIKGMTLCPGTVFFARLAVIFEPFFFRSQISVCFIQTGGRDPLGKISIHGLRFFIEINRGRNKEYVKCTERLSIWCVICCTSPED